MCYRVLQFGAVCFSVLSCVAVCCNVLQSVAVWCSALQRVAVCCHMESVKSRIHTCTHVIAHIFAHTITQCHTYAHTHVNSHTYIRVTRLILLLQIEIARRTLRRGLLDHFLSWHDLLKKRRGHVRLRRRTAARARVARLLVGFAGMQLQEKEEDVMDDLRDGENARGADFKILPFKKLNLKDTGWHSILIGGVHPHRQATSMSPRKRPSSSRLHDLLQSPRCVRYHKMRD